MLIIPSATSPCQRCLSFYLENSLARAFELSSINWSTVAVSIGTLNPWQMPGNSLSHGTESLPTGCKIPILVSRVARLCVMSLPSLWELCGVRPCARLGFGWITDIHNKFRWSLYLRVCLNNFQSYVCFWSFRIMNSIFDVLKFCSVP